MIIQLAWRNIWRNKTRSIVIMLSVAIGLFAGIAVLALYQGMIESRVRTVIESEIGHLQIHERSFNVDQEPSLIIPDGETVIKKLRHVNELKEIAVRSITRGMLLSTTGSQGVQINGIIPEQEYGVSGLQKKILTGRVFHQNKKDQILISRILAEKMKLKLGKKLVLVFTDTSNNLVSAAFRISGIYDSGNAVKDEMNVYVDYFSLNKLLLISKGFHEVAILLKEEKMLLPVQKTLQTNFPLLQIQNWKEISPETALMVSTVDQYSYIIITIILFALAFGILNTMLMSVLERTRELGMMAALGTSRLRIFSLILSETTLLTTAGTPVGLMTSFIATSYFEKHGLDLSGMGKELMASFGYSTIIYPGYPFEKIPAIVIMIAATAILSSLLPAINALKLEPVESLRR